MTLAEIQSKVYFNTGADSGQFTNANMLISINNAHDKVHIEILQACGWKLDDIYNTDFPTSTVDLVADQEDYSFPTGLLRIHSVEVAYDGANFVKAKPLDENEANLALSEYPFSTANPFYRVEAGSIILYPTPTANQTASLKASYDRNLTLFTSADLTTGTKTFSFDRNFHKIIELEASLDWAIAKEPQKAGNFKALLDEMYMRLRAFYGSKNKDRKPELTPLIEDYL